MYAVCMPSPECYSIPCPGRPYPSPGFDLCKSLISVNFSIFLSGNLSITKWMKMNLTTDFHHNLMKKDDTGLTLLTTRVITLHGRSLLMIPTLSSSDLLSEVPPRHLQASDWTHQKGKDPPQDLTSDVFVYGRPNPDGSDHTPPMSILNFDDLLGRTFLLPMDENGERKRATISEQVLI